MCQRYQELRYKLEEKILKYFPIYPKLSTEQRFIYMYIMESAHKPINYEVAHYIYNSFIILYMHVLTNASIPGYIVIKTIIIIIISIVADIGEVVLAQ